MTKVEKKHIFPSNYCVSPVSYLASYSYSLLELLLQWGSFIYKLILRRHHICD